MREGSHIYDLGHLNTGSVDSADCGLTTGTGTFDICLDLTQSQVISNLCSICGSYLRGIGGVLL